MTWVECTFILTLRTLSGYLSGNYLGWTAGERENLWVETMTNELRPVYFQSLAQALATTLLLAHYSMKSS